MMMHRYAERGDDLYETPPEAVLALAKAERLPTGIMDPACGKGALLRVLRDLGHIVTGSDINPPAENVDGLAINPRPVNFLAPTLPTPFGIVTNPPYKAGLPAKFVIQACSVSPYVAMLLPLTFLEGVKVERCTALEALPLARVLVFRNRLPMMHRDGWTGNRARQKRAFAWFIWKRGHTRAPTIKRITWEHIA